VVLAAQGADGWMAERLGRLFAVEHITLRYGPIERLEVGPATATVVRLRASFVPAGTAAVTLDSVVPHR
jgi:hypothetical protein